MSNNDKMTDMELAHLRLLQRIREAAGDPEGKLTQAALTGFCAKNAPQDSDTLVAQHAFHQAQALKCECDILRSDFFSAVNLIQRIREAAGDPEGKLMQDELVERIREQRENSELLDDDYEWE